MSFDDDYEPSGFDEPERKLHGLGDSFSENPRVDDDEFVAEWASLIEDARADPTEGLPEVERLVREALKSRGYDADAEEDVADEALDVEIRASYLEAREIADRLRMGDDVPVSDVTNAMYNLELVFSTLVPEADKPVAFDGGMDPAAREQLELEAGAAATGDTDSDD